MNPKRRVVVTGLGPATPIGLGVDAFWEALLVRRCGIGRVRAFDASGLAAQVAGELPAFSLGDFIPKTYRKNAKVMSRDTQIAVICAHQAARDADLHTACLIQRGDVQGPSNVDATRFGANIGAGLVCADLEELAGALNTAVGENGRFDQRKWGREGMSNLTPLWLLKFLPNMLACHVTIVHDAQAPSNTITCGEASSHLAIGEAFRTLARGDADVCICGGAESKVNPMAMARPLLLERLNTTANDSPDRACRPFGRGAGGTVCAEGGGLVILETLEHARRRGARIYCELVGFGASSNVHSWRAPDPTGACVALALKNAVRDAGITRDDIGLAAPFGAGVGDYDASEAAGWSVVFGTRLRDIPALVNKGLIGLMGAGSGAVDFAMLALAMYRNTVPPSANVEDVTPSCPFKFNQKDPVDANAPYGVTLGYTLSGSQLAALVVRKFEE